MRQVATIDAKMQAAAAAAVGSVKSSDSTKASKKPKKREASATLAVSPSTSSAPSIALSMDFANFKKKA